MWEGGEVEEGETEFFFFCGVMFRSCLFFSSASVGLD